MQEGGDLLPGVYYKIASSNDKLRLIYLCYHCEIIGEIQNQLVLLSTFVIQGSK